MQFRHKKISQQSPIQDDTAVLQKRQSGSWGPYNRDTYWQNPNLDRTFQVNIVKGSDINKTGKSLFRGKGGR